MILLNRLLGFQKPEVLLLSNADAERMMTLCAVYDVTPEQLVSGSLIRLERQMHDSLSV